MGRPSTIFVANHDIATLDVLVAGGFIPIASVTTRKAFAALGRFLPWFKEHATNAHIFCMDSDRDGKQRAFYFLRRLFAEGEGVFLFPSGTQKKRITHRIQRGLFLLARAPGAQIKPLFFTYDPPSIISESEKASWAGFLARQLFNTRRDIIVRIASGAAIDPMSFSSDVALSEHIKRIYQSAVYDRYDQSDAASRA